MIHLARYNEQKQHWSINGISPMMLRFFLSCFVNDSRQISERLRILGEQRDKEKDKFILRDINNNFEEIFKIREELNQIILEITKQIQ